MSGEAFAQPDKALDDRTIGHNPERLSLLKVGARERLLSCLAAEAVQ